MSIQAILQRIEADWKQLGVDEIEIAHEDAAEPRALKVHLRVRVQYGCGPGLTRAHEMEIHRALLAASVDPAHLARVLPQVFPTAAHVVVEMGARQDLERRTHAAKYPTAAGVLAANAPHPHSPSAAIGNHSHGKDFYFSAEETPDNVMDRLRRAAALFPGMLAQDPDDAQHRAVDEHPPVAAIALEHVAWRAVFQRAVTQ